MSISSASMQKTCRDNFSLFILCLLSSAIFFAFSGLAQEDEEMERLRQDRERIKQRETKVKQEKSAVAERERSVLAELEDIGKQLTAKQKEVRGYERELRKCEGELRELQGNLEDAERRSEETQALLNKRLVALYKFGYETGQVSYVKLLLGSDSISDLMIRHKYMSAIAKADKDLLDRVVAERAEIDSSKREVEARRQQILDYKNRAKRVEREIRNKKEEYQKSLNRLQKSKRDLTRTLAELERSVNELEDLMAQLRQSSGQDFPNITDLGKQQGNMPLPVSGRIIENSAPSMKGVTIKASRGAAIRCVANGVVEYARWFDGVGYGQMVIVNHGNGYHTLYAHASELLVEEGQGVKAGQIIAKVGDTGSINGDVLYFEIWKGTTALSAGRWLKLR